ncbi:hypothetical protein PDENDC454_15197 [Paenibacillus dendritiformis C454]|uniref:Uncharacterized protein n=1 Tax=Paenibacillus dendritiformis C454 TaxID=1131935 RepID=H3SHM4_9BACL|nr:hypothetical protein PDENDC454_15197 [Paenibacillus dendritiformis C454]
MHLGSGSVYKEAAGALHIIPVHSQHRGLLFPSLLDELLTTSGPCSDDRGRAN